MGPPTSMKEVFCNESFFDIYEKNYMITNNIKMYQNTITQLLYWCFSIPFLPALNIYIDFHHIGIVI